MALWTGFCPGRLCWGCRKARPLAQSAFTEAGHAQPRENTDSSRPGTSFPAPSASRVTLVLCVLKFPLENISPLSAPRPLRISRGNYRSGIRPSLSPHTDLRKTEVRLPRPIVSEHNSPGWPGPALSLAQAQVKGMGRAQGLFSTAHQQQTMNRPSLPWK